MDYFFAVIIKESSSAGFVYETIIFVCMTVKSMVKWIQKTKRNADTGGTIHEMDDRIGYTRIGILLPQNAGSL